MSFEGGGDLAGKVALVTGAGKNIGRAIARSLAAGGASVMVNVNTSVDSAKETVRLIEQEGGRASYFVADVTDEAAVDAMVGETVSHFGQLDALINNHTLRGHKAFEELSYKEWRRVVAVILDGVFLTSHAAIPHLIAAGSGAIVNIGGQHGYAGGRGSAHVGAGKLGVLGMTRSMALDLAQYKITVNCVVPGLINTTLDDGSLAHARGAPPIGRLGTVEEVAAMVRHLCGPNGGYITGQAIHMNGGGFLA